MGSDQMDLEVKKSNLHKARICTNSPPFIDNLCAVNEIGLLEKYFKEFYLENWSGRNKTWLSLKLHFLILS